MGSPTPLPTWAELRKLADAQVLAIRALMIGAPILVAIQLFLGPADPPLSVVLARTAILVAVAATLYWLAKVLREPAPMLWAILALLHFALGLIVFALLRARATRQLRDAGIDAGVLGISLPEAPLPGVTCRETAGSATEG
jgi:hypothetical protein